MGVGSAESNGTSSLCGPVASRLSLVLRSLRVIESDRDPSGTMISY